VGRDKLVNGKRKSLLCFITGRD